MPDSPLAAWGLWAALGIFRLDCPGQVTASGIARDSVTREAIPFVNAFLASTTRGTVTDEAGQFTLKNVPSGSFDLLISHLGYRLFRETISTKTDQNLTILLRPQSEQLKEVVVRSRRHTDLFRHRKPPCYLTKIRP